MYAAGKTEPKDMAVAPPAVTAFCASVTLAINSIRDLSTAKYNISREQKRRDVFTQQLQELQNYLTRLEPLQRLKTDRLRDAVSTLQQTVTQKLTELEALPPIPGGLKRCWLIFKAFCTGPGAVEWTVRDAAQEVSDQIALVKAQEPDVLNEANIPLVKQALLSKPLPTHFQRPAATLDKLKQKILQVAEAAPAEGPPPVVQLLGMPGMGKSTLALALAKELEREGGFSGGVYFLHEVHITGTYLNGLAQPEHERGQDIDKVILNLQVSLLDQLRWSEHGSGVSSHNILHQRVNSIFQQSLSSRRHLLVLDDIFHPCIPPQLRFTHMRGVILLTAREPMCSDEAYTLHLNPTPDIREAAKSLLEACAGKCIADIEYGQQGAAKELLEVCHGNMLAARICGTHLKKKGSSVSWSDLLDNPGSPSVYREPGDYYCILSKQGTTLISDVKHIWNKALCSMRADDQAAAKDVLRVLQLVDANKKRLPSRLLLRLLTARLDATLSAYADHMHDQVLVALRELSNYCVLCQEEDNGRELYYAHRLVDEVLIKKQPQLQLLTEPGVVEAVTHAAVLLLVFGRLYGKNWARDRLDVPEDRAPLRLSEPGSFTKVCRLVEQPSSLIAANIDDCLADLFGDAGDQDSQNFFMARSLDKKGKSSPTAAPSPPDAQRDKHDTTSSSARSRKKLFGLF